MEYIVISNSSLDKLVIEVNFNLKEGFKCQGGVNHWFERGVVSEGQIYYMQAMVKDK